MHGDPGNPVLLYLHGGPGSSCFDFIRTLRSNLVGASRVYSMLGKWEEARKCIEAANEPASPVDVLNKWGELGLEGLGREKDRIFMHAHAHTIFSEIYSDCPNHLWDPTQLHFFKLRDEGEIFKSQLPLIQHIHMPSLVLKGKYDTVFSPDQEEIYRQMNPAGEIVEFTNSAHFPRIEEPDRYADIVCRFVRGTGFAADVR